MKHILIIISMLFAVNLSAQLCCCADDDLITSSAVDDNIGNLEVGSSLNVDVSSNDVGCSSGVTTYSAPYNLVNLFNSDITGTPPNYTVTPSTDGTFSWDYDILCDGVVNSSATVSGVADPIGDICDNPCNCGVDNCGTVQSFNVYPMLTTFQTEGATGQTPDYLKISYGGNINSGNTIASDVIDMGDGNTYTVTSFAASHIYASPGTYTVVRTITFTDGVVITGTYYLEINASSPHSFNGQVSDGVGTGTHTSTFSGLSDFSLASASVDCIVPTSNITDKIRFQIGDGSIILVDVSVNGGTAMNFPTPSGFFDNSTINYTNPVTNFPMLNEYNYYVNGVVVATVNTVINSECN